MDIIETKRKFKVEYKRYSSDTITPVSVFLRLRDEFSQTLLLESSDYNSNRNSYTFIVVQPHSTFVVKENRIIIDGVPQVEDVDVKNSLKRYIGTIDVEQDKITKQFNGLYGFTGFEAVKYFDNFDFVENESPDNIPELYYGFYKYIIAINHFQDELIIMQNVEEGQKSNLKYIEDLVLSQRIPEYKFETLGDEISKIEDEEFLNLVNRGKDYCQQGEVFQIVFSRRFVQKFQGDEFNVYRALRSINPSPYLFYFDYGDFKLFGSSPESQLVIARSKAVLNPIAGTYKKTGIEFEDEVLAVKLSKDPKENAEHTMLVDLARNDLSRYCTEVKVDKYKEIQHFSHVLHIVSEVSGKVEKAEDSIDIFASTFPAGTLSGAPKYRALELINKDERFDRTFYGGTIGILSLSGDINSAITIRSFLSQNGLLQYQAGAGIVVDSNPETELKEVDNKLGALRKAIEIAKKY